MRDTLVVAASVVAAILLGGLAGEAVAGTSFPLGPDPALAVVLLVVGAALPQAVLYRADGDPSRLGTAVLAAAGAGAVVLAATVHWLTTGEQFEAPVTALLWLVVTAVFLGSVAGAAARNFRAGWREGKF